jgi:hypothetical protein
VDGALRDLEARLEKSYGSHVRLAKEGVCVYV